VALEAKVTSQPTTKSRSETSKTLPGRYGIDAPYVPVLILAAAIASAVLAGFSSGLNRVWWAGCAVLFLASTGSYLYATPRGRFLLWRRITDQLQLRGDERVLDVGCGRGMAMLTVTGALPYGHLIGIDLWRSQDQSGNDIDAALANATAAGVSDRVEFRTANMAELPFPDGTFDLVVANVSIQNLKDRARRRTVIDEIVRVTKPGGRVRLAYIQYARQYRDDLEANRGQRCHRTEPRRPWMVREPLLRHPPGLRNEDPLTRWTDAEVGQVADPSDVTAGSRPPWPRR
jgi:arsenite methyltransferase